MANPVPRLHDSLTPELQRRIAASIAAIGLKQTAALLQVDGGTAARLTIPGAAVRSGSIALAVMNADKLAPLPAKATGT